MPLPEQKVDLSKPVYSQLIDRRPDGVYTGRIYVAIGGITRGHIELLAADPQAVLALAQALMGFAQSQQAIAVVPAGAIPPNGRKR
jgi:hypothetical protein